MERVNLEVGGLPIPGPVILAYMIAFLGPGPLVNPMANQLGSPHQKKLLIPKHPLKGGKEEWRTYYCREQLPALCTTCRRLTGYIEGGRLEYQCWKCKGNIRGFWDRLGVVNALVPADWASDPVACAILAAVYKIRAAQPTPLSEREYDEAIANL